MAPEIHKADLDPEFAEFLAELKRREEAETIETERIISDAMWGEYGD